MAQERESEGMKPNKSLKYSGVNLEERPSSGANRCGTVLMRAGYLTLCYAHSKSLDST
jgi:hypothetical protein